MPESAIADARRADAALARGGELGPLHGVPITLKDCFETRGVVTAVGTTGLASHMPERDATVAERLKRAGAILLGKTNVPELLLRFATDNYVYGRTNNPYDLDRIPAEAAAGLRRSSRRAAPPSTSAVTRAAAFAFRRTSVAWRGSRPRPGGFRGPGTSRFSSSGRSRRCSNSVRCPGASVTCCLSCASSQAPTGGTRSFPRCPSATRTPSSSSGCVLQPTPTMALRRRLPRPSPPSVPPSRPWLTPAR